MKVLFLSLATLTLTFITALGFSQSVTFNVSTVTDNGPYSPRHVLAIWIKTSNGTFVKSIKVNAAKRIQYLYKWNKSSGGNIADAVTGATLTSHQAHTATWNCKNTSGVVVPAGNYKMMIEYTDQHAQGPIDSVNFTISGSSQHVTQADQSYFKTISLDFTPATTGIEENNVANQVLSVYPNPSTGLLNVSLSSEEIGPVNLKVVDLNGRVIHQELIPSEKLTGYPIQLKSFNPGLYIIELLVNKKLIKQKVILN
jgi:hypothetical protein